MKAHFLIHPRWVRYLLLFIPLISLLMPASISTAAPSIEVIVDEPVLNPPSISCSNDYWYPIPNNLGHTTYLTLNVFNPPDSYNSGKWRPTIPQAGFYRVEAYIAGHSPIPWCTGQGRTIDHDTTDARYTIHSTYGEVTRSVSQYPLSNAWLNLGVYYFNAGQTGYVSLADLNGETAYSTTISFGAMRFTYVASYPPPIFMSQINHSDYTGNLSPAVGVVQAQGFDVCTLPPLSTMQTWWNHSPYLFYGLYLGGVQLPAQCGGLTAAWVSAAHQQGWSFIPTWVGLQPPCSPLSQKMSSDPATSYVQGRQEADSASSRAATLGLTNNGLGGTIIYYDMEVFGGADLACRQAAASFMNGWVERLGELGNIAGGYGAHNSYVEDWATIAHPPKDVWAAAWYAESYDPYASVNGIPWLVGLWTNHQRIRQYAGEIHDSWGGIGMVIDSNVADGEVALPPSGLQANPIIIPSSSIEDTGWLSANQGWLVSAQRLYWTSDQGKNWKDISPAAVQMAEFLPSGQAWAFASLGEDGPVLYSSTDRGTHWKSYPISLPAGEWKPLQLHFSTSASGWLSLRLATSQAFDIGLLLKTSDGGLTWQTSPLPTAGELRFTSLEEGWLTNTGLGLTFHTADGGISWKAASATESPEAAMPLPAGTTRSGWLTNALGWAATSNGACLGEKGQLGYTCQADNRLLQSIDGGKSWSEVPLPVRPASKQ